MSKIVTLVRKLKKDQDGAALIEYTVLLGILVAAVIGIITTVGGKVLTAWTNFNTAFVVP